MKSIVSKLYQLENDYIIQCSLEIIINILKYSIGIHEEKILEIITNFLDLNKVTFDTIFPDSTKIIPNTYELYQGYYYIIVLNIN